MATKEYRLKQQLKKEIANAQKLGYNIRFWRFWRRLPHGVIWAVSDLNHTTKKVTVSFAIMGKSEPDDNSNFAKLLALQRLLNTESCTIDEHTLKNKNCSKYVKTVEYRGDGLLAIMDAFNMIKTTDLPIAMQDLTMSLQVKFTVNRTKTAHA
jgi:hypothetical protein